MVEIKNICRVRISADTHSELNMHIYVTYLFSQPGTPEIDGKNMKCSFVSTAFRHVPNTAGALADEDNFPRKHIEHHVHDTIWISVCLPRCWLTYGWQCSPGKDLPDMILRPTYPIKWCCTACGSTYWENLRCTSKYPIIIIIT